MATPRPILLFGADGQLGWELHRTLAPLAPAIVAPGHATCDLADADQVRRAIAAAGPGLIVNAAAYTAVDAAEDDEAAAFAVNAAAPAVMAEEARRRSIALLHYSTDYVFDGRAGRPYREDDRTSPINAYGRSKLAGEAAITDIAPDHLIFRTSWVYAARGSNFLLTMLRLAGEREELRVVDDQRGAPTWARMVAEGTAAALAARRARRSGAFELAPVSGIYHLTAGGETTWYGFTRAIVEHLPAERRRVQRIVPVSSGEFPRPAPRPAYSVLDNARVRETFAITLPDWQRQLALCLAR